MKPLIHRKARNGRSRKYCIILNPRVYFIHTLKARYVPTYIVHTIIRKKDVYLKEQHTFL